MSNLRFALVVYVYVHSLYVLDSMICEPIFFSVSGSTPFTVACVPTGIYTGVRISPCGV